MTSENFYWKKLLPDELAFRSVELEIMRSMLPVWLVRSEVNGKPTNGHPTDVWVWFCRPTDSKKCYACIWRVKNDEFIGYIETSAEKGVVCSSNVPQCAGSLPDFLNSCKPVPFKNYFWEGAEAEGKDVQTPPGDDAEKKRQGQVLTSIQQASETQCNYKPEDVDKAKKRANERWRRSENKKVLSCSDPSQLEEIKILQSHIEQKVVNFTFPAKDFSIAAFNLPFYKDYSLYRITDRRGLRSRTAHFVAKRSSDPNTPICLLGNTSEPILDTPICLLGNTSEPILDFNKKLLERDELLLRDEAKAADYLVFFCRFVHGEAGAFPIIEDISEDLNWIGLQEEQESENKKNEVERWLRPVQWLKPVDNTSPDSNFYYSAFVCYGRDLFFARFRVAANGGEVEMDDDELCFDNLPIVPVIFDEEVELILRQKIQAGIPEKEG